MRDFASLNKMPPDKVRGRLSILPPPIDRDFVTLNKMAALQVVDPSIIRQIKAVVKRSQGAALGFSPAPIYRDKDPSGRVLKLRQPALGPDGLPEPPRLREIPAALILLPMG